MLLKIRLRFRFSIMALDYSTRAMVDEPAERSLYTKIPNAFQLIEVMASNDYQAPLERSFAKTGVMELDTFNTLMALNTSLSQQLTNLTKKISKMQVHSVHSTPSAAWCDICGSNHSNENYKLNSPIPQEQVN